MKPGMFGRIRIVYDTHADVLLVPKEAILAEDDESAVYVGSFEFTYGEIGRGTTTVTGDLEMEFEDSWALFCVHHYNQDGLIRAKSKLAD